MAQILYSLYDSNRIITGCQLFEEWQQPANATALMVTVPMAKPTLNTDGTAITEGGTATEVTALARAALALKWSLVDQDINDSLTTEQSSDSLNAAYPDVKETFTVYAKKVGTGMVYTKISGNDWAFQPFSM